MRTIAPPRLSTVEEDIRNVAGNTDVGERNSLVYKEQIGGRIVFVRVEIEVVR
jgi:hypothetical protein